MLTENHHLFNILNYILLIVIVMAIALYILFFFLNMRQFTNKIYYDPNKKINEVLILGTHNSLTYTINNIFSPFAKTQTLTLKEQLESNVRFFDLRFKIKNNTLIAYHHFINLHIDHLTVFSIFFNFLKENPKEFIIINIKNEEFGNDHKIISFLYDKYITPYKLNDNFVLNDNNWSFIPYIKDIQGKIFIFNFYGPNGPSLSWANNAEFVKGKNHISDIYMTDQFKKILYYKKFIQNNTLDRLNIFFFSLQYNNILGLKYDNQILANQLVDLFNNKKNNLKLNMILVFDFFEMYYSYFF